MRRFKNIGRLFQETLIFIFTLFTLHSFSQNDTAKRQSIDITSSYKPVLKDVVKINFSASPLVADTFRQKLAYDIPAQNLFFAHQPVTLKPLALSLDTGLQLGIRNYVKAGFGNLSTPYISAALSFGDGRTSLLNLYGNYVSSKGKIKNQDFSEIKIKGTGSYFTPNNEAYGSAAVSVSEYFLYGYDHSLHTFLKDDIRRKYQDIALSAGFRNTTVNNFNLNYNLNAGAHVFSRENKVSESTLMLEAPVEKRFGENVAFKVAARAELTNFTDKTGDVDAKFNNNLFQVFPELAYYSDVFTFHGGVTPSWDNSELSVLPNIYGEAQLQHNILMVQGGWVGRYIYNTFRSLSTTNPYMQDPSFLLNTKEVQFYGGIKATPGKHFSFNAKASFITYHNMPLFINDSTDGKSFYVSNESKMNNVQLHGDLNYVSQDKFTLSAALDLNDYTGLKDNADAWHLIPVQLTGSIRWNAFKQVLFKADAFAFSNVHALLPNDIKKKLKGGVDVSAGAEFKINDKFSAWLDLNNIFNTKYERWNNYPVYGLNVIGGAIVHF